MDTNNDRRLNFIKTFLLFLFSQDLYLMLMGTIHLVVNLTLPLVHPAIAPNNPKHCIINSMDLTTIPMVCQQRLDLMQPLAMYLEVQTMNMGTQFKDLEDNINRIPTFKTNQETKLTVQCRRRLYQKNGFQEIIVK